MQLNWYSNLDKVYNYITIRVISKLFTKPNSGAAGVDKN